MGPVKLEFRSPQSIDRIAFDPQPDWTFDSLLSEINSIENQLNGSSIYPLPFTKTKLRELPSSKNGQRSSRAFVMHVSDNEMEGVESDDDEETHDQRIVPGRRFTCDELYVSDSDDSEDESAPGTQLQLMEKVGLVEGALLELTHEHHLSITEEIRNQILALETHLTNENEKFSFALARVEKSTEVRREMDRKLDLQYQRRIAEALDNHLTAVQRDHEHRSQIEERRIRDDAAAYEEVKRKEKALLDEKLRQERMKAEEEARLVDEKKKADEAKAAALEANRRAAKEAADKNDSETSERAVPSLNEAAGNKVDASSDNVDQKNKGSGPDGLKKYSSEGIIIRGAQRALQLEERRLQIYKEVAERNKALGFGTNEDYRSYGKQIGRLIRQIRGSKENVRTKADDLIKSFFNPRCPQSISIQLFVEQVVAQCENADSTNNIFFAYGHVIGLVTSQVPVIMDLLLAKLNEVCIYTVPKYISYLKSAFETKEAYFKAIGYREEERKIESRDVYVARMESCVKLYGALVQTEVNSIQNIHGLTEGWSWVARLLNTLPPNVYTAVVLQAFLEMAGFALYSRYKSQFNKLLNTISSGFLIKLKEAKGDDLKLNKAITTLQTYIDSKQFLKEPEGWRLTSSLLSHSCVPEQEYQQQYHGNRFY